MPSLPAYRARGSWTKFSACPMRPYGGTHLEFHGASREGEWLPHPPSRRFYRWKSRQRNCSHLSCANNAGRLTTPRGRGKFLGNSILVPNPQLRSRAAMSWREHGPAPPPLARSPRGCLTASALAFPLQPNPGQMAGPGRPPTAASGTPRLHVAAPVLQGREWGGGGGRLSACVCNADRLAPDPLPIREARTT